MAADLIHQPFQVEASRSLNERGASAVEYSILAAGVAGVVVAAVFGLGQATAEGFEPVTSQLEACSADGSC